MRHHAGKHAPVACSAFRGDVRQPRHQAIVLFQPCRVLVGRDKFRVLDNPHSVDQRLAVRDVMDHVFKVVEQGFHGDLYGLSA